MSRQFTRPRITLTEKDIRLLFQAGALHTCEGCGCTEITPCPGGCAWDPEALEEDRFICTECIDAQRRSWTFYWLVGNAAMLERDGFLTRPGQEAPWQDRA
jgi:hypothetical protein